MATKTTISHPEVLTDTIFAPNPYDGRAERSRETTTLADSFYDTDGVPPHLIRTAHPISVEPVVVDNGAVLVPEREVEEEIAIRTMISPEQRMEDSFRIPIFATLVFVITMLAIFYLGSQVAGYYAPVVQGGDVEFVGRPN
jgi:hypothetical protein